ncbi:MAG: 4a-hydroxytetrahydrobiopterin dehydratase [Gammaproteobacteria bacterium]
MPDMTNSERTSTKLADKPLSLEQAMILLKKLDHWNINETGTEITREFKFANYYETISFINTVAWIAHQENHHPTLIINYNRCKVLYNTHSVNGLSNNDFTCATRIDSLLKT